MFRRNGGEESLDLEGSNYVEWAKEKNKRGEKFGGKWANYLFAWEGRRSKLEMWQTLVRTKKDRLDWKKPKDVFVTQHRVTYRCAGIPGQCSLTCLKSSLVVHSVRGFYNKCLGGYLPGTEKFNHIQYITPYARIYIQSQSRIHLIHQIQTPNQSPSRFGAPSPTNHPQIAS